MNVRLHSILCFYPVFVIKIKNIFFLADSWPQVFDDSEARQDWLWKPKYDLTKLVERMLEDVQTNYIEPEKQKKIIM